MQYQPLLKLKTTTTHQETETKPHITLVTDNTNKPQQNNNKLRFLQQPITTSSCAATTGRKVMTNLSSTSNSPHQQHPYHHDSTIPSPPPPPMLQGQHQHQHHSPASVIERASCKMPRSSTATAGCYDMENMKPNLSPDTNSYLGKNHHYH